MKTSINRSVLWVLSALLTVSCGAVESNGGRSAVSPAEEKDYTWSVSGFTTDFSRMTIDPEEILSGGPSKDGIPAVDSPRYESQESAQEWIGEREPVILIRSGSESRIYPFQILTWHEIINDELGGTPLAVTFCPLCNTGIVFHRNHRGTILDFGTTGRLRNSNLLMYDRQSETWWQQATGEGVIGTYTGEQLKYHPSLTLSFRDARAAAPGADVVSRETGYSRPYGQNPYTGYDRSGNQPFLYSGSVDPALDAMERVLVIRHKDDEIIIPYSAAVVEGTINIRLAGDPVILVWSGGTASALDTRIISEGRDVGSLNAFLGILDGREIRAEDVGGGRFRDTGTASLWDSWGRAVEGVLAGKALEPLTGVDHFWFSAQAFSKGELYTGPGFLRN